MCMIEYKN